MSNTNPSQKLAARPFESEVAHLFSFALGAVTGFNIAKRDGRRPPFEDLPQGYSLAGGRLDSLAGDAFLRVQSNNWFLIEMKRDFKELASELRKERVLRFMDAPVPISNSGNHENRVGGLSLAEQPGLGTRMNGPTVMG